MQHQQSPTIRAAKAKGGKGGKGGGGGGSGDIYKDTVLLPKTDFPQRGNAKTREPEIQEFWKSEQIYEKLRDQEAPLGPFVIHDGPPYANGSLHMGHALNKIIKDVINKFKMSKGYKVRFIPGWDCHGLPIELKVLQSLKSKQRKELTPLRLREIAADFAKDTVAEQRKSFERYGVWGEFDDPYLTLLPKYEAAQLGIFEEMVKGGHIYRGRKPVYWSPSTRTALAESELEYPEGHTSPSIYLSFKCQGDVPAALAEVVGDTDRLEVAVWTTTPWTIPANRAVAINPELTYAVAKVSLPDGRSKRLIVAEGLIEALEKLFEAPLEVESTFLGGVLEGLQYVHPLTGATAPVVIGGDYITTESGTGLVHTAPGHGQDDFLVGQKYGLEVAAPLDDAGNYTKEVGVESLVGANVLKDANEKVIELLQETGQLLKQQLYKHKYPYDWRSKKPVITRATPQWFASIDGLRDDVLASMDKVKFIPEGYANRMRPMLVGRSDWCISRQRIWGVPIPAFYRKDNGEALMTPEVIRHVREIVEEKGTNAWFELSNEELLPEEHKKDAELYTKGTDTMDVWFDSGSSWAAVEEAIGSPVDLYLEGSDQHRGWFQSSLITSVAVRGKAPYKAVMTHGFTVDENGRKMSKSIGNVIDPKLIIDGGGDAKKQPPYGADTLRLWVASVDFSYDVSISQNIMASIGENVKKIRNRARFILGNIHDFDEEKDAIAFDKLAVIDRYVVFQAEQLFQQMEEAYEVYALSKVSKLLVNFLQDFSAFYLDVVKDRLYISGKNSADRRACQTVLRWLILNLARVMSPILCHMAEDIWQNLPGSKPVSSIFLSGWWEPFPRADLNTPDPLVDALKNILTLKEHANLALEKARKAEFIRGNLEAKLLITVPADSELLKSAEALKASPIPEADQLRWYLGVSGASMRARGDDAPAADGEDASAPVVEVAKADGKKCDRCWVYCPTVGDMEDHPGICQRCGEVVQELGLAPAYQDALEAA